MKENEEIPEILSTHPASENRAFDLEKLIPAVNFKDYLQLFKICNFFLFEFMSLRALL